MSMHQIDLNRVDLNLLVVFEALMRERHVGRAASRLSLSQSATSHALGRLRAMFDDPLFVRHPRGIEPTPRGRALAQPVSDALSQLRAVLDPPPAFDPNTLARTFTIAAHDYALAVLMPSLMTELRSRAPGVDVRCLSIPPSDVIDALDRGDLDFALGGFVGIDAHRVTRTTLFSDRFVGVARRNHPRLKSGSMSLEDFIDLPHVLVSATGQPHGDIDHALVSRGLERRVAMTVPSFLALPYVVEQADVIGVLPERLALRAAGTGVLAVFDLPIDASPVTCSMLALAPLAERAEMTWLTTLLKNAGAAPARGNAEEF
jgi:DNA-binding transcriptional LysR family regulator